MKHTKITLLFTILLFNVYFRVIAQQIRVVCWSDVQQIVENQSDTTYILNFWATWCKPCVEELPAFEKLKDNFSTQKLKIIMISMDFVKDINSRVVPFVKQKQLKNQIWLLNEPDYDAWINKISPEWSGAIPVTLILNNKKQKKQFYQKSLTYNDLTNYLSEFL
jgi:thiol-disulfide isomerase/thioredoxin